MTKEDQLALFAQRLEVSWSQVSPSNHGRWKWMALPGDAPVAIKDES